MRLRGVISSGVVLCLVVACGGGDERSFNATGGTAGVGGGSSGSSGSGATSSGGSGGGSGGATGGTSGSSGASGSSGSSGSSGASGAGGVDGGVGGATGGTGGATGGTGGATGGTGGATGGSGGSGGAPACNTTTSVCAPDPGAGWSAPRAFYKGAAAPPACPSEYPTKLNDAFVGFTPGSAACSCSCDPAAGIACTGAASVVDVSDSVAGCFVGGSPVWSGTSSQCKLATAKSVGKVDLIRPAPSNHGTCAPKANHTLPTPTWGEQARACGGSTPQPGTCAANQTCVSQAFAPYKLCVSRPGNFACPPGYTSKVTTYDSFSDTRACSTCTCGSATSTCGGDVTFRSGCSGIQIWYSTVSGCGVPNNDIDASQWGQYTPQPTGTCPASTPTLSGTAAPGGEATVCCMP